MASHTLRLATKILPKLPGVKILWKGAFRRVSADLPETLRKVCLSTKFPHQEIR